MGKINFTKILAISLLIGSQTGCFTDEITFEKVEEFIPKSAIHSETHLYVGDLNCDGVKDVLLRFKVNKEPAENEHFYILLGEKDGPLKVYKKDIFSFNNKNGIVFDKVTISKGGSFTVKYRGVKQNSGSYRKITFSYHADELGHHYWILNRDEELYLHKIFAPAPQNPTIITESEMRDNGGKYFSNIKENLYDEMLLKKIKRFIPDSTSECRAYSGDLNLDNFDDIILRFKKINESEFREHFHLFLGQNNGTYKLTAKNDSLMLDGTDGTDFDNVLIKKGFFTLEYKGYGNTSGSYENLTFKYSNEDKSWLLYKIASLFVHRHFTEEEPNESIQTQKDFGKILFKDYR